jgi:nitroreductase/NAD-dependent dihydropyrimidine dehydrogenase PreA subunit
MTLFTVDPEKCNRDGICVQICPFALIEMKSEDAIPTPVEIAPERCMNCGHCMAVCPTGALTLDTMNPADCIPVQPALQATPEQIAQLVRARRSIRVFKDKPVPRETISHLLDIVAYAPSGHNSQMVQWLVIDDRAEIQRLAGMVIDWMRLVMQMSPDMGRSMEADILINQWDMGRDYIFRSAPALIIAHAPQDHKDIYPARSNFTIAMTVLELAALSMGLGGCWAGFFQAAVQFYPPMNEAIGLPPNHLSYECLMLGYPKYRYQRIPLRNAPKITWR